MVNGAPRCVHRGLNVRPGLRLASPAAFAHGFTSDDLRRPTWFRPRVPVQALVQPPARVPQPVQARAPPLAPVPARVPRPARSCSRRRPPRPPANSHTDQPTTIDAFPWSCSPPGLLRCLRPPPRPAKTAMPERPTRARPNRTCNESLYHSPSVSTDFFAASPRRVWLQIVAVAI